MLISLSGLPGTGKTTLARTLAHHLGAIHLRIDTIEQATVDSGAQHHPVGAVGYYVARAQAGDHLAQGWTVIADCVNPVAITRDLWRQVAHSSGVAVLEVEVVCSQAVVHAERVRTRVSDIPGLPLPTWEQLQDLDYEPWARERLLIDTAHLSGQEAALRVASACEAVRGGDEAWQRLRTSVAPIDA